MRILTLTMAAFGSFATETTIDFTTFGNHDLYLISGETGSGKTTIFDAIMFALYGTGSGDERKAAMFRSEYANETVETYVTLHFQYGEQTYTITRKPGGYAIQKRNGRGTRIAQASVQLQRDGSDTAYTKDGEVRQEINRILGVNRDQFKQIAMLAQGEFKQLLTENTTNKQEMFRSIFHTGNYDKLVEELKKRQDEEKETYEMHRMNIVRERKNVQVQPDSSFAIELQRHQGREDVTELEAFLETVRAYQEEETQKQKTLQDGYGTVEEQLRQLNVVISENNRLIGLEKKMEEAQSFLMQQEVRQQQLQQAYEAAQEEGKNVTFLNQSIGEIQSKMTQYERLTVLKQRFAALSTAIERETRTAQQLQKKQQEDSQKSQKLQQQAEQKDEILVQLHNVQRNLDRMGTQAKEQEEIVKKIDSYQQDLQLEVRYIHKHQKAYDAFAQQNAVYRQMEDAYYAAQAGLLARKVERGKPCPVCGSLQHDEAHMRSLLESLDASITKESVEEAKEKKEQLEKTLQDIVAEKSKHEGQLQTKKEDLEGALRTQQLSVEVMDASAVMQLRQRILDLYNKAQEEMRQSQMQVMQLQKEITACEKAEAAWKEMAAEAEKEAKQLADLQIALSKAETEKETVLAEQKTIQAQLQFASQQEAQKEIARLNQEIATLQQKERQAKERLDACRMEMRDKQSQIALWKKELEHKEVQDERKLEQQKEELVVQETKLQKDMQEISARMVTNQNAVHRLEKEWSAYQETEKKLGPIRELYLTFDGNYGNRMKLETFIQTEYFDRILARANVRLYEMSNQQYQLRRKTETNDKRTKGGMDIEVWDFYTNSAREVASLSGGESFMASLALALGLSDEVQQRAGGVHFDSLFIDEGFGSLDEGTLSKAITVLAQLSQNQCTIGIISHVSALMERIEKQIVVTKDPAEGSSIEIRV